MAEKNIPPAQPTDQRGKILMQWSFDEIEHHRRSVQWYVVTSIIAVSLITYAIFDRNYLFALMIILLAFIYYIQSKSAPLQVVFTIYQTGIQIGDSFFLYRELKDFAVIYEPPMIKRLYLHSKTMLLRNELSIPLLDQNPIQVRKILLDFLPEDLNKEQESGTDAASRVLKL